MTLALAVRLLAVSAALGAGCALPPALRLAGAGFPAVGWAEFRTPVLTALGLGALGVFVFAAVESAVRRLEGFQAWRGTILATFASAAPAWAWIGVALNRRWAIRPQEVLSSYSLQRNRLLLLGLAVATLLLSALIHRWRTQPPAGASGISEWRHWIGPALVLGVAGVLAGPVLLGGMVDACGPPPVIVLLAHAGRADGRGVYRNPLPTSPVGDAVGRDGVRFALTAA